MHYVVIGGGVAGVSCIETLLDVDPKGVITLVSPNSVIKGVNIALKLKPDTIILLYIMAHVFD